MLSGDDEESKSILVGVNNADNSPVMVPRKIFEEHAHILGDSGSGKTSMGISPILNQLIRQNDCSIIVIDLKGDDTALFSGTRSDALAAGKRFRWFTNELDRSTYAFNPLTQEYFKKLSLYQKTDVVTSAIGLQYGTDYGRGFFSDTNADYLYRAFQQYRGVDSFQRLASILPGAAVPTEVRRAGSHLISITNRLASTESLNVGNASEHPPEVLRDRIDFADVFRTPQVVYFHLPGTVGSASSAEIARIALYSLLGSARLTPNGERKQVFVFIDEFQRLVAGNLEMIMQTARSMRIGLILANQSMSDLNKNGIELSSTVSTNTRYKQVFAASDGDETKAIVDSSGETLILSKSFGYDVGQLGAFFGGLMKINQSETISPRLRVNDVLLAADASNQSIVHIRRGAGYAQYGGLPFVMRSDFHISPEEYKLRKASPWPPAVDGTLLGKEVEPSTILNNFAQVATLNADSDVGTSGSAPENPGLESLAVAQNQRLQRRKRKQKPTSADEPKDLPTPPPENLSQKDELHE